MTWVWEPHLHLKGGGGHKKLCTPLIKFIWAAPLWTSNPPHWWGEALPFPYLALRVPILHSVFPFSDLPLHSSQFVLEEAPHDGHVAPIHPVVVNGDSIFLKEAETAQMLLSPSPAKVCRGTLSIFCFQGGWIFTIGRASECHLGTPLLIISAINWAVVTSWKVREIKWRKPEDRKADWLKLLLENQKWTATTSLP